MSDTTDLDALLAIVRLRTPGKWYANFESILCDIGTIGVATAPENAAAIVAAINNFEPLIERCKQAEAALERFARSLERAGKDMYDLVGENKRLTRQFKQLLAALEAIDQHWTSGNFSRKPHLWEPMRKAIASVKGGTDGKA